MAKKLGVGLGELDWGDDEAKLRVKFPRARSVSNRTSVNPATSQRTQTPELTVEYCKLTAAAAFLDRECLRYVCAGLTPAVVVRLQRK